MASQMSSMVAVRGQQQAIAYQAPASGCGSLVPLTSLVSNEIIGNTMRLDAWMLISNRATFGLKENV